MTALTNTPDLVKIGKSKYPFVSLKETSKAYRQTVEELCLGASEAPKCLILAKNKVVAHVTFNGRVFAGHPREWKAGATPLYCPRRDG